MRARNKNIVLRRALTYIIVKILTSVNRSFHIAKSGFRKVFALNAFPKLHLALYTSELISM